MKKLVLVALASVAISGCGGGGSSSVSAPESTGSPSVAAKTSTLAAGSACTYGGIRVETGVDANKNGILDSTEVSSTQDVCNGAPGATGATGTAALNALVKLTQESAGSNCAAGGVRIDSGTDANRNSTLDSGEIATTYYTCNGSTGPQGGLVPWVIVTGTTQQAVSNTAYLVTGSKPTTITLPASPVVGDTLRIVGSDDTSWKAVLNQGQSFDNKPVWLARPISATNWSSIASSSDGTKLVAIGDSKIYTSSDGGGTWSFRKSTVSGTSSSSGVVASSSDGTKLLAADSSNLYTSTDSGLNWVTRNSGSWSSVASSSDGTKLLALDGMSLYRSTDSGVSWTSIRSGSPSYYSSSLACSADGTKILMIASDGIYKSADSGTSWLTLKTGNFVAVSSSADGTKLLAAESYMSGRYLYTSEDSGFSWTPSTKTGYWQAIASSSDGTKLIAADYGDSTSTTTGGYIYTSSDRGLTWLQSGSIMNWKLATISGDGANIIAAAGDSMGYSSNTFPIYTFTKNPTSIGTSQGQTSVELLYTGLGKFKVISIQ